MNITPAILPHTFEEVQEKLIALNGIARNVQIDLCDGVFGREKTWQPTGTETLPPQFSYEFDIMMTAWQESVMHALSIGANAIVAHVDFFSETDVRDLVSMVVPRGARLGVAVSNDKSVDFHAEKIRQVKALYPNLYIQVMGIRNIGEQGQFFDEEAPERIKVLKQTFGDIAIQVDGAITPETIKRVMAAGAETAVVGSFLFGRGDVAESYGEITRAAE